MERLAQPIACCSTRRRRRKGGGVMWLWPLLLVQLCLLQYFVPGALSATLPADVHAMREIYQAWEASPLLATKWFARGLVDPCGARWEGVVCSGNTVIALKLNNSGIVGNLPPALGSLHNLDYLDLSWNAHLGGQFLAIDFSHLSKLVHMDLSSCNISGNIGTNLRALTNLQFIDVSRNAIQGALPDFLFNLPHLGQLNLSFNQFNGTFYMDVVHRHHSWTPLQVSLEHNDISSVVSHLSKPALKATLGGNPLCNNMSLSTPDLCNFSNGAWNGPRVWSCASSSSCNNALHHPIGGVVDSFVFTLAFKWSTSYGLNDARLGHLQRELAMELGIALDQVFVRWAYITNSKWDEVLVAFEFVGLLNLVDHRGALSRTNVIEQLLRLQGNMTRYRYSRILVAKVHPPKQSRSQGRVLQTNLSNKENIVKIIIPVVIGAVLLLVILCAGIVYWWVRKGHKPAPNNPSSELFGLQNQQPSVIIAYDEVKIATRNFHRNNKIGEGAFGAVYKGVLGDGQEVAIKQLSSKSRRTSQEFMDEVQLITSVRHGNIVSLRGCAMGPNSRLLVYEYLENRSLAQALFDPKKGVRLEWPTRFNIALGTAHGLAHLHNKSQARLVHSDIKATNILLDKVLEPKIADFGLARLFQNDSRKVHTFVAGARGYVAPEFALQGQLTSKADVFSFGILTLELVSGRKNMDINLPKDQQYLLSWAWQLLERNEILELIDPKVRDICDESQVLLLIRVALLCTQDVPADRPNMTRVISMLTGDMPIPEMPTKPGFLAIGSNSGPSSRATSSTSLVAFDF